MEDVEDAFDLESDDEMEPIIGVFADPNAEQEAFDLDFDFSTASEETDTSSLRTFEGSDTTRERSFLSSESTQLILPILKETIELISDPPGISDEFIISAHPPKLELSSNKDPSFPDELSFGSESSDWDMGESLSSTSGGVGGVKDRRNSVEFRPVASEDFPVELDLSLSSSDEEDEERGDLSRHQDVPPSTSDLDVVERSTPDSPLRVEDSFGSEDEGSIVVGAQWEPQRVKWIDAIAEAKRAKDIPGEIAAVWNLGCLYRDNGRQASGVAQFSRVDELLKTHPPSSASPPSSFLEFQAAVAFELAQGYQSTGDTLSASEAYQRSLDLAMLCVGGEEMGRTIDGDGGGGSNDDDGGDGGDGDGGGVRDGERCAYEGLTYHSAIAVLERVHFELASSALESDQVVRAVSFLAAHIKRNVCSTAPLKWVRIGRGALEVAQTLAARARRTSVVVDLAQRYARKAALCLRAHQGPPNTDEETQTAVQLYATIASASHPLRGGSGGRGGGGRGHSTRSKGPLAHLLMGPSDGSSVGIDGVGGFGTSDEDSDMSWVEFSSDDEEDEEDQGGRSATRAYLKLDGMGGSSKKDRAGPTAKFRWINPEKAKFLIKRYPKPTFLHSLRTHTGDRLLHEQELMQWLETVSAKQYKDFARRQCTPPSDASDGHKVATLSESWFRKYSKRVLDRYQYWSYLCKAAGSTREGCVDDEEVHCWSTATWEAGCAFHARLESAMPPHASKKSTKRGKERKGTHTRASFGRGGRVAQHKAAVMMMGVLRCMAKCYTAERRKKWMEVIHLTQSILCEPLGALARVIDLNARAHYALMRPSMSEETCEALLHAYASAYQSMHKEMEKHLQREKETEEEGEGGEEARVWWHRALAHVAVGWLLLAEEISPLSCAEAKRGRSLSTETSGAYGTDTTDYAPSFTEDLSDFSSFSSEEDDAHHTSTHSSANALGRSNSFILTPLTTESHSSSSPRGDGRRHAMDDKEADGGGGGGGGEIRHAHWWVEKLSGHYEAIGPIDAPEWRYDRAKMAFVMGRHAEMSREDFGGAERLYFECLYLLDGAQGWLRRAGCVPLISALGTAALTRYGEVALTRTHKYVYGIRSLHSALLCLKMQRGCPSRYETLLSRLAEIARTHHDHTRALHYYQEIAERSAEQGRVAEVVYVSEMLGDICATMGEFELAHAYLSGTLKVLELQVGMGRRDARRVKLQLQLSRISSQGIRSDRDRAIRTLQLLLQDERKGSEHSQSLLSPEQSHQARMLLCRAYLQRGWVHKVEPLLDECASAIHRHRNRTNPSAHAHAWMEYWTLRAKACSARGRLREALFCNAMAIRCTTHTGSLRATGKCFLRRGKLLSSVLRAAASYGANGRLRGAHPSTAGDMTSPSSHHSDDGTHSSSGAVVSRDHTATHASQHHDGPPHATHKASTHTRGPRGPTHQQSHADHRPGGGGGAGGGSVSTQVVGFHFPTTLAPCVPLMSKEDRNQYAKLNQAERSWLGLDHQYFSVSDVFQECTAIIDKAYDYFATVGDELLEAKALSLLARVSCEQIFPTVGLQRLPLDERLLRLPGFSLSPLARWSASSMSSTGDSSGTSASNPTNVPPSSEDVGSEEWEEECSIDLEVLRDASTSAMEIASGAGCVCLTLEGYANLAEVCYLEGRPQRALQTWREGYDQFALMFLQGPSIPLAAVAPPSFLKKLRRILERMVRFALCYGPELLSENLLLLDTFLLSMQDEDRAYKRHYARGETCAEDPFPSSAPPLDALLPSGHPILPHGSPTSASSPARGGGEALAGREGSRGGKNTSPNAHRGLKTSTSSPLGLGERKAAMHASAVQLAASEGGGHATRMFDTMSTRSGARKDPSNASSNHTAGGGRLKGRQRQAALIEGAQVLALWHNSLGVPLKDEKSTADSSKVGTSLLKLMGMAEETSVGMGLSGLMNEPHSLQVYLWGRLHALNVFQEEFAAGRMGRQMMHDKVGKLQIDYARAVSKARLFAAGRLEAIATSLSAGDREGSKSPKKNSYTASSSRVGPSSIRPPNSGIYGTFKAKRSAIGGSGGGGGGGGGGASTAEYVKGLYQLIQEVRNAMAYHALLERVSGLQRLLYAIHLPLSGYVVYFSPSSGKKHILRVVSGSLDDATTSGKRRFYSNSDISAEHSREKDKEKTRLSLPQRKSMTENRKDKSDSRKALKEREPMDHHPGGVVHVHVQLLSNTDEYIHLAVTPTAPLAAILALCCAPDRWKKNTSAVTSKGGGESDKKGPIRSDISSELAANPTASLPRGLSLSLGQFEVEKTGSVGDGSRKQRLKDESVRFDSLSRMQQTFYCSRSKGYLEELQDVASFFDALSASSHTGKRTQKASDAPPQMVDQKVLLRHAFLLHAPSASPMKMSTKKARRGREDRKAKKKTSRTHGDHTLAPLVTGATAHTIADLFPNTVVQAMSSMESPLKFYLSFAERVPCLQVVRPEGIQHRRTARSVALGRSSLLYASSLIRTEGYPSSPQDGLAHLAAHAVTAVRDVLPPRTTLERSLSSSSGDKRSSASLDSPFSSFSSSHGFSSSMFGGHRSIMMSGGDGGDEALVSRCPLVLVCSRPMHFVPWELLLDETAQRVGSICSLVYRTLSPEALQGESSNVKLVSFHADRSVEDRENWLFQDWGRTWFLNDRIPSFSKGYDLRFPFSSPLHRYSKKLHKHKRRYKALVLVDLVASPHGCPAALEEELTSASHTIAVLPYTDLLDMPDHAIQLTHLPLYTLLFVPPQKMRDAADKLLKLSDSLGKRGGDPYEAIVTMMKNFGGEHHLPIAWMPSPALLSLRRK